jgi:hypothetical protein
MGYMTHHHCKQRRFLEIRYVVLCLKLEIMSETDKRGHPKGSESAKVVLSYSLYT